jgi:hypothetical protein
MPADNEFVAGYEMGASTGGLEMGGCGESAVRLAMVLTLGSAAVGFVAILVIKSVEKAAAAKTSEAWARAAQLDAQANVIDARTAQIGTVLAGIAPYLLAVVAFFAFALVAVAMFIYMDARAKERQDLLLAQGRTQLSLGGYTGGDKGEVDVERHRRSNEREIYRQAFDGYCSDSLAVCPSAVSLRDDAD